MTTNRKIVKWTRHEGVSYHIVETHKSEWFKGDELSVTMYALEVKDNYFCEEWMGIYWTTDKDKMLNIFNEITK